jgi:hypothetical protein
MVCEGGVGSTNSDISGIGVSNSSGVTGYWLTLNPKDYRRVRHPGRYLNHTIITSLIIEDHWSAIFLDESS